MSRESSIKSIREYFKNITINSVDKLFFVLILIYFLIDSILDTGDINI